MIWLAMLCIMSSRIIWGDIAQRRIKNHELVILAFLGITFKILELSPFDFSLAEAIFAGSVAFVALLPFYTKGWMGAADVKLAGALGLWLGLELLLPVWILSVLMALIYVKLADWDLLKRWLIPADMGTGASLSHQKFVPYGAMLCLSAILVSAQRII